MTFAIVFRYANCSAVTWLRCVWPCPCNENEEVSDVDSESETETAEGQGDVPVKKVSLLTISSCMMHAVRMMHDMHDMRHA